MQQPAVLNVFFAIDIDSWLEGDGVDVQLRDRAYTAARAATARKMLRVVKERDHSYRIPETLDKYVPDK